MCLKVWSKNTSTLCKRSVQANKLGKGIVGYQKNLKLSIDI